MKKLTLCFAALAALMAGPLLAQDRDITGTWQGTLHAAQDMRILMKVSKTDAGGLKAVLYNVDQAVPRVAASAISLQGSSLKFAVTPLGATYEGKLTKTDGVSSTEIWTGMWTQGPRALRLDLVHVNEQTAWSIPELPPAVVPMAADAAAVFEVATIKPSVSDARGLRIGWTGRNFHTLNTSLSYMIEWAYGIHSTQLTGGPGWTETDRYDLAAIPDLPGVPNDQQSKTMLQKLLADRFQLTFHHEKKELTVFAITVAKTGLKLTPSERDPNGTHGLAFVRSGILPASNVTMKEFAGVMQRLALDRPVIDQTGLSGRYDFTLTWTPDESQFGGRGAQVQPQADGGTAPPDLFTAMQQQMGLKLESVKAEVDVIVIDHVEKPSEN
jgi:uncharacterized protein (TIGR03435 family)